jgi:hypothetical protein
MRPHREFGNILFAMINCGWLGYVIFSATAYLSWGRWLDNLLSTEPAAAHW